MRLLDHPEPDSISLDAVLAALSDPVRRMILLRLSDHLSHELSCMAMELPVSKSTCTHHFRVLREAGLLSQRYEGTSIMNSLRSDDMEARFPGLLSSVLAAAKTEAVSSASGA